jgi:hypothetical protein
MTEDVMARGLNLYKKILLSIAALPTLGVPIAFGLLRAPGVLADPTQVTSAVFEGASARREKSGSPMLGILNATPHQHRLLGKNEAGYRLQGPESLAIVSSAADWQAGNQWTFEVASVKQHKPDDDSSSMNVPIGPAKLSSNIKATPKRALKPSNPIA